MTRLSEIIDLFTKLASELQRNSSPNQTPQQRAEEEESPLALAISSFNQSLNYNETSPPSSSSSGFRVLDTALSMLCFNSSDICRASLQCMADTILALLSSSISCRVSRVSEKEEPLLQIGSSISVVDCPKLIEACADVIGCLDASGMLSHKILRAVLEVAASASFNLGTFSSSSVHGKSSCKLNTAISKLCSFMPEETSTTIHETPLRLFLWYLDPLRLKHDISQILREMLERPFICLKKELHDRVAWRSIIICLVISPSIFIETRALLHSWFLVTGLASVLELRVEIVSSALDVLARPMQWGLSMELGLKLPFSHSYFPSKHRFLLAKLAGPISCENFLDLVRFVKGTVVYAKTHLKPATLPSSLGNLRHTAAKATNIDHKSIWALLMDFPTWFYFAVMLLFWEKCCQDIFPSACKNKADETKQTHDAELHYAAARFLAWIMNPINENQYDQLIVCMTEISKSWVLKQKEADSLQLQCHLDTCTNDTMSRWKKLKKPRNCNSSTKDYKVYGMELWLKDFHHHYVHYYKSIDSSHEAKSAHNNSIQPSLLFRKIPLGILFGCSSYLDEKGHELLLHYAATGEILGCDDGNFSKSSKIDKEMKSAIAGASLVFTLFEIIEEMSDSMFETEGGQLDFVCQVKQKVVMYLVKCVKKLLEGPTDEGRVVMLMDLRKRLARWMQQGREIFEGSEVLSDVVSCLNSKICSLQMLV